MRRQIVIYLVLVLLTVSFASAALTYQVALTSCGLDSSSYFCGDSIIASCAINDTLSTQGVNSVVFSVGGNAYQVTEPIAGNRFVGVWQVSIPVTNTMSTTGSLDSVIAYRSDGKTCSASSNQNNVEGCWVNFTSVRDYTLDCTCTFMSSSVCNPNNVATVTHLPGPGCSGKSDYVTYATCSFCDPQWTPVYSACVIPSNATNTTRLFGVANKTYYAKNQWCLDQTEVDSLKIPPKDNGVRQPLQTY